MSGRAVWGLLVLGWRPVWGLGLAPRVPYLLGLALVEGVDELRHLLVPLEELLV